MLNCFLLAGYRIMQNKQGPIKSTIIASGSGLGKSGACLCGLEMDIRQSLIANLNGVQIPYKPTLLVVPVQMIPDWVRHIRDFTRGYKTCVYYNVKPEKPSTTEAKTLPQLIESLSSSDVNVSFVFCLPRILACANDRR